MPSLISTTKRLPFQFRQGELLAVDPKAYGQEFDCIAASALDTGDPLVTVLQVTGPLSYGSWLWQSYDGVKAMIAEACKASAPVICMRVHSPGGDLFGAFDCARDIRAMVRAAGKSLVVHVEAQCASAAYALAVAADEIVVSSTSQVGSIGVLCSYMTAIAAAAKEGLQFTLIASGEQKTDGNNQVPIDEPMRARLQAAVDGAAEEFFRLVSELRPGLSPDALRSLQAGVFMGQGAVDKGLADRVLSWSEYSSELHAPETVQRLGAILSTSATATAQAEDQSMPDDDKKKDDETPVDEARAALAKKAESEDPVEAARAKRALAAYDEVPEEKAEDDKENQQAKAQAIAAAPVDVYAQLNAVAKSNEALQARLDAKDFDAIFAGRPDLSAAVQTELRKLPVAQARSIVAGIPVAGAPIDPAAQIPQATQGGAPQFDGTNMQAAAAALPPDMQAAFGFGVPGAQRGLAADGRTFVLGAPQAQGAK